MAAFPPHWTSGEHPAPSTSRFFSASLGAQGPVVVPRVSAAAAPKLYQFLQWQQDLAPLPSCARALPCLRVPSCGSDTHSIPLLPGATHFLFLPER